MTLMRLIVFSRMKRQKTRLMFVLLAIAASSCLIVWTIGGYQALFTEAMHQQADYLGEYDLRIGSPAAGGPNVLRGRGGGFAGPFSRPAPAQDARQSSGENRGASQGRQGDQNRQAKGENVQVPVRTKLDLAFMPDGKLDLKKLPQGVSQPTLAIFFKADQNKDGLLDAQEQESVPILKSRKHAAEQLANQAAMGERGGMGGRGGMMGPGMTALTISPDFIKAVREDPSVIRCDETSLVRAFVYSKNMKSSFQTSSGTHKEGSEQRNLSQRTVTAKASDTNADVPAGIDPELHRNGMAYYRSVMGIPSGMGSFFMGTTAAQPPYELKEGKWLDVTSEALQAVLTEQGAEQYKLRPGDSLLVITKTKEYQLEVIGIVEDKFSDGFYVSVPVAEKISGSKPKVNSLALKLRIDTEEFRNKWNERLSAQVPGAVMQTGKDIALQKKQQAREESHMFRYQAICGTLLAVLAAVFIIFTALNMSVDEQRRQIAFYRTVGLSRGQIGCSILLESLVLALPGWFIGIVTGWFLLWLGTGRVMMFDGRMTGFSFVCAVFGAIVAALYPMLLGMRVRPMEAIRREPAGLPGHTTRKGRLVFLVVCFFFGLLLLGADLFLVFVLPMETDKKALLHSGLGIMLLAGGVLCLIPVFISLVELLCLPVLAFLFRFDSSLLRGELSGNVRRTTALTVVLSIGGGLFVSMQIWGYSMLGPFLPGREMPDAFAAFLPVGLQSQYIEELRTIPDVKSDEFLSVAVEQAAFAQGSVPDHGGMGGQFANLVFFGVDIHAAFAVFHSLVELHFVQGERTDALLAMRNKRGVVITDSVSVDYKLNVGDTLKVQHPRKPGTVLEYPIVGVVSFPGWQWLSKTGGVRRNFGRSGGIAFADQKTIIDDYQLDCFSYFWFNTKGESTTAELEKTLDALAQKNLRGQPVNAGSSKKRTKSDSGQAAYVKLSTRESLLNSISRRADSVIWALSKMPLMTLVITSVAVVGVIMNSVRSRRRLFGVLRSVGMTRFAIVRIILVESVLIGIVASVSSFLFGSLAACGALKLGQSMFGTVDPPLIFPWQGLLLGLAVTIGLCLAAALYPAVATGQRAPLELLQEERNTN